MRAVVVKSQEEEIAINSMNGGTEREKDITVTYSDILSKLRCDKGDVTLCRIVMYKHICDI